MAKNTFGHRPAWSRAPASVPGAPASSARTWSHDPVAKLEREILAPDWGACALLCTSQPARPNVVTSADAAGAIQAAHAMTVAQVNQSLSRICNRKTNRAGASFCPWALAAPHKYSDWLTC
jgi:hypothetical protein